MIIFKTKAQQSTPQYSVIFLIPNQIWGGTYTYCRIYRMYRQSSI